VKRTRQHVIADQGLTRVMRLCADAGWAADRVVSDYGEDLILQTTYGQTVDAFRTLVQVKTTSRCINATGISCRVSVDHALRWVRNAEPVVVVLWHKPTDRGWYAIPADQMTEYQLLLTPAASTRILFDPAAELTPRSLDKLAWRLRLEYFKAQFLAAARADHDAMVAQADGFVTSNYRSRMPIIALNLFRFLNIATDQGLNPQIRPEFACLRHKIQEKERELPRAKRSKRDALDHMAATLCLLVHIQRLTGLGTPIAVAEYGSEALLNVIRSPHV